MSTPTLSFPLRSTVPSPRRTLRTTRFALQCEPLECRQLLSVGQAAFGTSAPIGAVAPAAQLAVPAQVFNPAPSSASLVEIEFGTLGGVSQLQIIVFGAGGIFSQSFAGGPVFSPTPTASFEGSGLELGSLSGIVGANNAAIGNGATGVIFPTTSLITPLNPNLTSSTNTPGGPPAILVVVPLATLVVHLSPSAGPATNQSNSTLISNLDEQPPSTTHFGQGDVLDDREMFVEKLDIMPRSSSLIDFIEPFRPIAPDEVPQGQPAPQGDPAPAPDGAKIRPLPPISDPIVDAALGVTDARVLTRSRDADTAQPDDDQFSSSNTSWSLSAIFGAAAVATGGYHLALREADRFRGRWIPRWAGAERPTKRKSTTPSR